MTIAFIAIARTTFDIPFAQEKATQALHLVETACVAQHISLFAPPALITDLDQATALIAQLQTMPLALVVLYQATFADSTLATALAEALEAPLLLWATPEPQMGGRLRLNSFCGINLAAFALKKRGKRYAYLYQDPQASTIAFDRTLNDHLAAAKALAALQGASVGVVGEHPAGFEPCAYDADSLQTKLGVMVRPYDLEAMFSQADSVPAAQVEARYQQTAAQLTNLPSLNPDQVRGTLSFYEAMQQTISTDALRGVAIRCWPETFLRRDCAICAASSMLSDSGTPASCEADVNGTVSSLLLQSLSGSPVFSADLVSVDAEANSGVFWHCGLAPLSMCDPDFSARGTLHTNRQKPLLMEFPLKPGRITLARLTQAGEAGHYRLVIGTGEMLQAPMQFTGTSGVCRFDSKAQQVLDTILYQGLDHHFSIAYGNHASALRQIALYAGLEVINL
jgi:L-fucose isomerase-like protein